MCKKLSFLISFVLLLSLGSNALAEDLNPPDWACAPGSVYIVEEFDEESPSFSPAAWANMPEAQLMVPHPQGYEIDPDRFEWIWGEPGIVEALGEYESPVWGMNNWITNYKLENEFWHEEYEGRYGVLETPGFGFMMSNFEGEGTKHIRIQMVTRGPALEGAEVEGEGWWEEMDLELISEIDLGNGWFHYTYLLVLEFNPGWEAFSFFTGVENLTYIDQLVVDTICFLGDEPPLGLGAGCRADDPNLSSNPIPGSGEDFVDPAVVLTWDDPNTQMHPPALTDFDVYLGVHSDTNDDPNVVRDVNTLDPTPDMNWGTQYFWRVDTIGADDTVYKNVDWNFTTGGKTWDPDPDHNDWWVPLDVNLYWQGDQYVQTYNLDFNDTSPPDACQIGLGEPNFLTLTTLQPLTTYYWQVAEVNNNRGGVLHVGDIWKFTTEDPCGVPYDDYLGAGHDKRLSTTSSWCQQENDGWFLVDGSGLDTETMLYEEGEGSHWFASSPAPDWVSEEDPNYLEPNYPLTGDPCTLSWVMFDLGYEYELWLTWIWNCNEYTTDGMRYYTVHYSLGGAGDPWGWSWSQLGDIYELPMAPDEDWVGLPGYVGSAGPPFQGTNARYILFTSKENWAGGTGNAALSEVKFELFPRYEAVAPIPSDGAIDMPIDVNLAWTPGAAVQQAGAHKIFFGESWDEVNAMVVPTWTKNRDDELVEMPPPSLEVEKEYFWRVDEVNDACAGNGSPWRSDIWSFTTEPFVRIDDFEAYKGDSCAGSPRHLRCIWEDYFAGVPRLGTFVYRSPPTSACPGGPHGGAQTMFVKYMTDFAQGDDPDRVFTRRTYSPVQNWSEPFAALSIWFYGDLNDVGVAGGSERITAEDMYVTLEDEQGDKAKIYYVADGGDDVDDLIANEWIEWHIALRDFNEVNDINLDKIDSISIGVVFNGALPVAKQKGQVWFDDIRLYAQRCVPRYAVDFSSAPYGPYLGEPDCFVDEWDTAAMFDDWLVGDANYQSAAPGDANLLVEYLFDACAPYNDLYDSSGNERHGIAINDVDVHAGMLTLVNVDEVNDFNAVRIPLDANTFNGPRPFTIVMDVNIEPGSVMFGVSPPSPNDPCVESASHNSYDQAMTLFHSLSGEFGDDIVTRDHSYQGPSGSITESGVAHGQWYTVATTSDGNSAQATYLIKGRQMWVAENEEFPEEGPQMLLPERHKVMIGYSYHLAFNDPEFGDFMGAEAMNGDADNVRVYNRALSAGEIVYLSGVPAGQSIYMPVVSVADLYEDEPAATSLESTRWVNFKDYAVLVEHWLEYQPFPPDED